jgi:arsenite methyltransferase
MDDDVMDVEETVRGRYSDAARAPQASLCCPTRYDPALLEAIPQEVLDRDYGCGDPTAHLRQGDVVLDLGSGSGKHCFMAGQVVGPQGWVVGIDANEEMLALARRAAPEVAQRVGYANVWFRRARIQDLALDLDQVDAWLAEHPIGSAVDLSRFDAECARLRGDVPVVADGSVDVVISNCVLNLVRPEDKQRMFQEIHRVLRSGGRAVISDIVSDEDVPAHLQRDPELWSGCISGAFREDAFLEAFAQAGLHDVRLLERQAEPWREVEGLAFRSVTVSASKRPSNHDAAPPQRSGGSTKGNGGRCC